MNCALQCTTTRKSAADNDPVVLLHGSASSGAFWRDTSGVLQPLYPTIAPDLIGYGRSKPWPAGKSFSLNDEFDALAKLLPCCGGKFHLVGYSYGGVVALHLALANPARIRTLTHIEPVFFAALRYAENLAAYRTLCRVRDDFLAMLANGDKERAMSAFVDFWTGEGAWRKLSDDMRASMTAMAGKIALDWKASFAADPGRRALARLGPKTILLRGNRSPIPMLHLVDALHALMPGSSRVVVPGAGHLLPRSHNAVLNGAILSHLHAEAERSLR